VNRSEKNPAHLTSESNLSSKKQQNAGQSVPEPILEEKGLDGLGLDGEERKKILEEHREAVASNRPVEFYGKVIDQDGRPVPGVTIEFELVGYNENFLKIFAAAKIGDEERRTRLRATSDNDGLFSIKGVTGRMLGLKEVQKEGYGPLMVEKGMFVYDPYLQDLFHPDPQKPVVFHLWKKGPTDPLIKTEESFKIISDGRIYTVDLLKRKIAEGTSATGDLRVQVKCPEKVDRKTPYLWSFIIDSIEGGILETNDPFPYRAPDSGYEPGYEVIMDPAASKWKGEVKRQFYVKSRGGKVHASVEVTVFPNYDGRTGRFRVNYLANPNNSRNLEYDPSKQINKE